MGCTPQLDPLDYIVFLTSLVITEYKYIQSAPSISAAAQRFIDCKRQKEQAEVCTHSYL